MVKLVLGICETLSSIPSTRKIKKRVRRHCPPLADPEVCLSTALDSEHICLALTFSLSGDNECPHLRGPKERVNKKHRLELERWRSSCDY